MGEVAARENVRARIEATTWLPWHFRPRASVRVRLFCLPYAGGSAALYRAWPDLLPADIEVCPIELPGRGRRIRQPAIRSMADLVNGLLKEMEEAWFETPFAIFGHSMGAMVAFEFCQELARRGQTLPTHLHLSAAVPQGVLPRAPLHQMSDDEFVDAVRALNGTPDELFAHPELLALVMPVLRADFQLVETWTPTREVPLAIPTSLHLANRDRLAPPASATRWEPFLTSAPAVKIYTGDHFFLGPQAGPLTRNLSADLGAVPERGEERA